MCWCGALTHEYGDALWQDRCQAGLKCVHLALVFNFSCFVQCFQIMSRSLLGLYYLAGGWVLCTFVGLTCACLCSEQMWESMCEKPSLLFPTSFFPPIF